MVDDRARNDSGQYDDRLPPETVLDVLDGRDDLARPVTAGDVVDALDVSRRTALNKLNELDAAGTLESRTVGARARVFWKPIPAAAETRLKRLSNDLRDPITVGDRIYEDGDAHPVEAGDIGTREPADAAADEADHSSVPNPSEDPGRADSDETALDAPDNVEGANVGALDLPGRGDDLRRRQAAMRAVLDHLRKNGTATTGDLRGLAWDVDGGTYADARSLWKNAILTALGEVDAAESSGPSGKWRWVGPTDE